MASNITITHVYITRGVVSAFVSTGNARVHRIGHRPHDGWFCCCRRGKRCTQIERVQELVPTRAIEYGARVVEKGWAPGGACTPPPPPIRDNQSLGEYFGRKPERRPGDA